MFTHISTTVNRIVMVDGVCSVSVTIETAKLDRGYYQGPNIEFEFTIPSYEIECAYTEALERGCRIFERFNAKLGAA
ncbi:hypothetical protein [Pelagibacterium sp.]|uniref:hypothetical protein n=1 Tax=Pelagibacterium sp. TaxID=1967288 RepID=UPI003A8EFFDF